MKRTLPLRTLLVDDSPEFLGRLEKWLVKHPGFEIVGKAYSGLEVVKEVSVLRPDLVVMDVAMPLMNGYEATVSIKEGAHRPMVILIHFSTGVKRVRIVIRKPMRFSRRTRCTRICSPLWLASSLSSGDKRRLSRR